MLHSGGCEVLSHSNPSMILHSLRAPIISLLCATTTFGTGHGRDLGLGSEHGVPGKPLRVNPGLACPLQCPQSRVTGRAGPLWNTRGGVLGTGTPRGQEGMGRAPGGGLLALSPSCPPNLASLGPDRACAPPSPAVAPGRTRVAVATQKSLQKTRERGKKNELRGLRPQSWTPGLCPAGPRGSGTGSGSTGRACRPQR